MATHSSVLAWRIPGTGKPGGLPSMGSHRVGHNWSDLTAAAAWFTRETNKTSRKEVCTNYVGCRRPSILLKERRHWGLPSWILEAQAKLVSLVGSALQMETQPEFERESDMGRPVFRETDPNSLFSMVYFYTLRCYAKVTQGQQSWLLWKSGAS